MTTPSRAPWRRIAAWCVDWLVILVYAGALVPLGLVLRRLDVTLSPVGWNLLAFAILIVPVTLWLARWESRDIAASPGKRALSLRVHTTAGPPPSFRQSLLRTSLKLTLPWELGHTAAFGLAPLPGSTPTVETVGAVAAVLANLLVVVYGVSLFGGSGRTPYDRIAGTHVA